jgi:hypothetical protein
MQVETNAGLKYCTVTADILVGYQKFAMKSWDLWREGG